jgi:hypothetical protein
MGKILNLKHDRARFRPFWLLHMEPQGLIDIHWAFTFDTNTELGEASPLAVMNSISSPVVVKEHV